MGTPRSKSVADAGLKNRVIGRNPIALLIAFLVAKRLGLIGLPVGPRPGAVGLYSREPSP
jgi:hypothetical protein